MKKQPNNPSEERKMKFAEAGVLFVLVLALTVFVGARVASHNNTDEVAEAAQIAAPIFEPTPIVAQVIETAAADSIEIATGIEPTASLAVEPPRIVTYAQAEQTYFDGDYAGAVDAFEAYAADHTENAWGYYMLGLSNWKAGDLDAADDAFVTALELKPDHVKSLINYGRVLLEQDQPAAARVQIELALAQVPDSIDGNRVYSRICHREGDLAAAADGYLKVLQIEPTDVWSLNNLGLIRIEQGDFSAALPPLAKAAGLNSEEACIQNNLGVALERTGHFRAAATAYEMALNADADYAKADESLDRVSGLTEAADLAQVDLVALAAGFTAEPAVALVTVAEDEEEVTEVPGDMDVASTVAQVDSEDPDHN